MRNILFIFLDVLLLLLTFLLSLYFSIEDIANRYEILKLFSIYYLIFSFIYVFFNFWFKNERVIYKFFSAGDLIELLKTILLTNIIFIVILFLYDRLEHIPRFHLIYNLVFSIGFLTIIRLIPRFIYFNQFKKVLNRKKTIIIGNEIDCYRFIKFNENKTDIEIVGLFILDNNLSGTLRGINILGNLKNLYFLIDRKKIHVDQILLATAISKDELRNLYLLSKENKINIFQVKIDNQSPANNIEFSKIKIENFLARPVKLLEDSKYYDYYRDKKILITGCGGSIGSDLVLEVLKYEPKQILGIDISEENIFNINQRIVGSDFNGKCTFYVSDIKNIKKIDNHIKEFMPDIIIHAAALKHVSISEDNCDEVINTNIFGTINILDCCKKYNFVKNFILVSTDKAVNPSSMMGMTKYITETICRDYAKSLNETKFTIVRFGNVLSSSGSVVPIFQKQIQNFGPITVSHPDVNRYFMLINEACSLILLSAAFHESEENKNIFTFMLDMGQPVKIIDLAKKMIELSSSQKDQIEIKITGLKKGEKLTEELFYNFEDPKKIDELPIFKLKDTKVTENFRDSIANLYEKMKTNKIENEELRIFCSKLCESIVKNNNV